MNAYCQLELADTYKYPAFKVVMNTKGGDLIQEN